MKGHFSQQHTKATLQHTTAFPPTKRLFFFLTVVTPHGRDVAGRFFWGWKTPPSPPPIWLTMQSFADVALRYSPGRHRSAKTHPTDGQLRKRNRPAKTCRRRSIRWRGDARRYRTSIGATSGAIKGRSFRYDTVLLTLGGGVAWSVLGAACGCAV